MKSIASRARRLLGVAALCMVGTALVTTSFDADARRLGGGKSFGMQRDTPAMRRDAAPTPSTANPSAAAPAANAAPGAAAPAMQNAAPKRSWLGPLAGLAAGLGLGALLGNGAGGVIGLLLMGALLIGGLYLVARMVRARQAGGGLQYAGQSPTGNVTPFEAPRPATSSADVSARSPAAPAAAPALPADFDAAGFAREAKLNFVRLQAAFDAANLDDLRAFTTPEVFAELKLELDERGRARQQTDVVQLDAEVLEAVTEPTRYVVSVRFHGSVREEAHAAPAPFDEVWHLAKPRDGASGWVVAGIQQAVAAA